VSEAVEFEVQDHGQPVLDGQPAADGQQAPPVDEPLAAVPVPGWTQQEAARVIGGLVAGITTAMYVFRFQAAPAPELVPAIAGDPEREFPLLGMSLAPILDLVAPKGSAAAVGVGLGAGVSELMGAMARRMPVLQSPPPQQRPQGPPPAPAAARPAPAEGATGFRFSGDALHVLRREEDALLGTGLE
jgi:hypothetical protein